MDYDLAIPADIDFLTLRHETSRYSRRIEGRCYDHIERVRKVTGKEFGSMEIARHPFPPVPQVPAIRFEVVPMTSNPERTGHINREVVSVSAAASREHNK